MLRSGRRRFVRRQQVIVCAAPAAHNKPPSGLGAACRKRPLPARPDYDLSPAQLIFSSSSSHEAPAYLAG